jgi:hypothetical protein
MWKNKRFGKKLWGSKYEQDKDGERVFILFHIPKGKSLSGYRKITFESWQAAKSAGWVKVK